MLGKTTDDHIDTVMNMFMDIHNVKAQCHLMNILCCILTIYHGGEFRITRDMLKRIFNINGQMTHTFVDKATGDLVIQFVGKEKADEQN